MITNKFALAYLPLPLTLVAIQMASTVLALLFAPCLLYFGNSAHVLRWASVVPPLFVIMLVTSMLALKKASMGAFIVVRNLSPLIALPLETVCTGERIEYNAHIVLSLIAVLVGVVTYVSRDIRSTPAGFFFMIVNIMSGITERMLQRKMLAVEPIDVNKPGLMLINNAISLILMVPLLAFSEEPSKWPHFWQKKTEQSIAVILLSCVNGIAISWAGMNCQTYVTATTFSVLTNMNKFIVIGVGIVWFREVGSVWALIGCVLALVGGVGYARGRAKLSADQSRVKEEQTKLVSR